MKLIIAGSRDVGDYSLIDKAMAMHGIKLEDITEIVSGCAKGVDSLAIKWAENNDIPVTKMPADWKNTKVPNAIIRENQYGKYNAVAGLQRNEAMGDYADALLAITNGSRGTDHMIKYMAELGKTFWVYEV